MVIETKAAVESMSSANQVRVKWKESKQGDIIIDMNDIIIRVLMFILICILYYICIVITRLEVSRAAGPRVFHKGNKILITLI